MPCGWGCSSRISDGHSSRQGISPALAAFGHVQVQMSPGPKPSNVCLHTVLSSLPKAVARCHEGPVAGSLSTCGQSALLLLLLSTRFCFALVIQGAIEEILAHSGHAFIDGQVVVMDDAMRCTLIAKTQELNSKVKEDDAAAQTCSVEQVAAGGHGTVWVQYSLARSDQMQFAPGSADCISESRAHS